MPKIVLPQHFFCPITNDVFKDPVTASDDFVYERTALVRIFSEKKNDICSPVTGAKLTNTILKPKQELATEISNFLAANNVCSHEEFIHVIKTGTLQDLEKLNYVESYLSAEDQEGMTPLHFAAMKSDHTLIEFLHREGALICRSSVTGMTPLHCLVDTPECTLSMLLVKLGNSPHTPDHQGITTFAKHKGHPILGAFFRKHAMPKVIDVPEEYLCEDSRMIMTDPVKASNGLIYERSVIEGIFKALEGNIESENHLRTKELIPQEELKQRINSLREQTKIISLRRFRHLVETGNYSELIRSIIPRYYFHMTINDEPFIFYVAKFGHVEMLSLFLRYSDTSPYLGNYLEGRGTGGRTLLHVLAKLGNVCSLRMVLNEGLLPKPDTQGNTPLHEAVKESHETIVAELAKFQSFINNPDCHGSPVLHLAAALGRVDITKTLLANGADPNSVDKQNMLPIHVAATEGRLQFVIFWMDEFNFTFETPCNHGLPLVLYIAQTEIGRRYLVTLLLQESPTWLNLVLMQYQIESPSFFSHIFIAILRDFAIKHDLNIEDFQQRRQFLTNIAPHLTVAKICDRVTCGIQEGDSVLSYLVLVPQCLELIPGLNTNSLTDQDRELLSDGLVTVAAPVQKRSPLAMMSQYQVGLENLSQLFLNNTQLSFNSQWLCNVKSETSPLFSLLVNKPKGREFLLRLLRNKPAHALVITEALLYFSLNHLLSLLDPTGLAILLELYKANEELLSGLSPSILAIHHQGTSVLFYFVNDVTVGWQILDLLFKKQPELRNTIERDHPNLLPALIKYDAGKEQTTTDNQPDEVDEEKNFRELFEAIEQQQTNTVLKALHFYYRNIKRFKQSPLKYAVVINNDHVIPTLLDLGFTPEFPKEGESVIALGLRVNHLDCVLNIINSRSYNALNLQDLVAIINHMVVTFSQKIMAACLTRWANGLKNCTCQYKGVKNTSLLQLAVALELEELIVTMLTQSHCVDHTDDNKYTAVHFASRTTTLTIETIKRVFESSQRIDAPTLSGLTALHLAVVAASASKRFDIVKALCSYKASKTVIVTEEYLVNDICLRSFTPVHLAICSPEFQLFEALLPLTKAEANFPVKIRNGKTNEEATISPLQLCALAGNEEVLKWYLKNVQHSEVKEAAGIPEQANKILRQKILEQDGSASSQFFPNDVNKQEKKLTDAASTEDLNHFAP